jgi:hypothetical protein
MQWFLMIILCVFIGICPRIISNTIQKAIEADYWERDRHINRLNNVILFFAWVIIIASVANPAIADKKQQEKIDALEKRIEALETPPQIDTVNILEVLPNE